MAELPPDEGHEESRVVIRIFHAPQPAEQALEHLRQVGFESTRISVLAIPGSEPRGTVIQYTPLDIRLVEPARVQSPEGRRQLIGEVLEAGVPETQAHQIVEGIRQGGTAMMVHLATAREAGQVYQAMGPYNPPPGWPPDVPPE